MNNLTTGNKLLVGGVIVLLLVAWLAPFLPSGTWLGSLVTAALAIVAGVMGAFMSFDH